MAIILDLCAALMRRVCRGTRAPQGQGDAPEEWAAAADTRDAPLSFQGNSALELMLRGADLAQLEWSNPEEGQDEGTIGCFLAPLLRALSGEPNAPAAGRLLERGFDHWSHGCSVLTSIDSISDLYAGLKVALIQELCKALECLSDAEIARVARPALDVLTRNPRYLEKHPGLAERLVRAGVLASSNTALNIGFLERNRRVLRLAVKQALEELRRDRTGTFAAHHSLTIHDLLHVLESSSDSCFEEIPSNDIRRLRREHERRLARELRTLHDSRLPADLRSMLEELRKRSGEPYFALQSPDRSMCLFVTPDCFGNCLTGGRAAHPIHPATTRRPRPPVSRPAAGGEAQPAFMVTDTASWLAAILGVLPMCAGAPDCSVLRAGARDPHAGPEPPVMND